MSAALRVQPSSGFDMNLAVERLTSLVAALRAAAPRPSGGERIGNLVLCRLSDWPEPGSAYPKAENALRAYGEELATQGGSGLMMRVYDQALHRRGHHAVRGVSPAWTGIEGWAH